MAGEEDGDGDVTLLLIPSSIHHPTMSSFIDRHASASPMASRARGRKQAKKGVQLTLMVVGTFRAPHPLPFLFPFAHAHSSPAGTSGTGRTTFVNTLCESNVLDHAAPVDPKMAHVEPGIQIKPITVGMFISLTNAQHESDRRDGCVLELEEEGVRVSLTVVDTPGFGDNIDNERWYA